jgi:hypothetical protein
MVDAPIGRSAAVCPLLATLLVVRAGARTARLGLKPARPV